MLIEIFLLNFIEMFCTNRDACDNNSAKRLLTKILTYCVYEENVKRIKIQNGANRYN